MIRTTSEGGGNRPQSAGDRQAGPYLSGQLRPGATDCQPPSKTSPATLQRLATELPADPLELIWSAALQRLELPSLRMLLFHQARLLRFQGSAYADAAPDQVVALVAVAPTWLVLAASRRELITAALGEVLGRPVAVELRELHR
ncbi:MAG: hypothetical protein VKM92_04415 [Cyanobacteriota bacterium]|nr:hypothetical protein [Cyanobacteriota bacterium]